MIRTLRLYSRDPDIDVRALEDAGHSVDSYAYDPRSFLLVIEVGTMLDYSALQREAQRMGLRTATTTTRKPSMREAHEWGDGPPPLYMDDNI